MTAALEPTQRIVVPLAQEHPKRKRPVQLPKTTAVPILLLLLALWIPQGQAATPIPAPPQVAASGHLLVDYDSGRVLSEENADQRLEPASLTKIMTAYVVMRELKQGNITLEEPVRVSRKAWKAPGSRMFIEVDKQVSVDLLLKGMIIQSGNDASIALAEHIAGSEEIFANLMNEHARRLGMRNTHFDNSTGLPSDNHYTTPRDIALVAAATIREFPEYYAWYAIREMRFNDIKQHNRNRLLWRDESVDGIKTGHTEAAGFCLVASARRDDQRLISVVMGTKSDDARARESQALLNYGFRFFETHRLYGAGEALTRVRIWKGSQEQLPLGLGADLHVTIPRNQYKNLKADMRIEPGITAPVAKGAVLGSVHLTLGGEALEQVPLIALEQVDAGGLWQSTKDSVLLWFE
ncbi:MAG: D-alanyl-D-alanine carboxypeptidase [gamma proteobacterium symbiont of Phacoides pectinatus]